MLQQTTKYLSTLKKLVYLSSGTNFALLHRISAVANVST